MMVLLLQHKKYNEEAKGIETIDIIVKGVR